MSRSALWRQEGNVKERQRQAEQLFSRAVEEGRVSFETTLFGFSRCVLLVFSNKEWRFLISLCLAKSSKEFGSDVGTR